MPTIIHIKDVEKNTPVEAELFDGIDKNHLQNYRDKWGPLIQEYCDRLIKDGYDKNSSIWPQSWHWDWTAKMNEVEGLLGTACYCISYGGETQGMMRIDLTKTGRLPEQKNMPLLYIDYLEVAPWNWDEYYANKARYRGVGPALINAAINRSIEEGFQGRIGLHSLPQAIDFYQRCGFTNLGYNQFEYGGRLPYFETTKEASEIFIGEKS